MTHSPDQPPPDQPPRYPSPPAGLFAYGAGEAPVPPAAKSGRAKIIARVAGGVLVAGVLGWTALGQADRDSNGDVVDGGSVDAMSITVGDCLADELGPEGGEEQVSSVEATPCNEPHLSQIVAQFDLDQDEFPGEASLFAIVEERCTGLVDAALSHAADSYELSFIYFYPTADTWAGLDHREALCGVSAASGISESVLLGSAG